MDTLDGIKTVIAVVETASFTAAGKKLGISKGLVSKYVSEVERELNIRLFNRNTRKLSVTDAGNQYSHHAVTLVEQYQGMVEDVIGEQSRPQGLLRVSSPIAFGEHVTSALLPGFGEQYPDIDVELLLGNRAVDMLNEGIDVRIKSGPVDDSNMIARPLCKWPMIVCASPAYVEANGRPECPQALTDHKCVLDSNLKGGQNWTFIDKEGKQQTVLIRSNIASNNPQAVVNIMKAGGGIGVVARGSVSEELERGTLVELFGDYQPRVLDIYMIYPHRKHIPQKVQCFINYMLTALGA